MTSIKGLPAYKIAGVDLIDKGLSLIKGSDTTSALATIRKATGGSVGHPAWNEVDREKLVEGAAHFGNDIEEIADLLPNKRMGDVVKRYYIDIACVSSPSASVLSPANFPFFKNRHALQEDVPQQMEEKVAAAAQVERKGKGSGKGKAAAGSDDEGSICGPPTTAAAKRARTCAVCATKTSTRWYRCPEQIGMPTKTTDVHVMCQDCGIRWRHCAWSYSETCLTSSDALCRLVGMQYPPTNPEDFKLIPAAKPSGREQHPIPLCVRFSDQVCVPYRQEREV